jgi:1-aminocyclopropane-1-carboxylate deaminase
MQDLCIEQITVDKISLPHFAEKEIDGDVLRLDKIHSIISGNKWFKLRYYIDEAKKFNKKKIVTFGGAWSNHILATAAICQLNDLQAIGIIRGEQPAKFSTTLKQAKEMGMELIFISRESYRQKILPPQLLHDSGLYLINEGGYGMLGMEGASSILHHCNKEKYTHICCATGTGTMMAGLIHATTKQQVIGISVLKNNFTLEKQIKFLLPQTTASYSLMHDYHFGGYARCHTELTHFMNAFYEATGIPSDFVYTGKLFYGVNDMIKKDLFPRGSKILLIHSGGLQGNNSLKKGTLIF